VLAGCSTGIVVAGIVPMAMGSFSGATIYARWGLRMGSRITHSFARILATLDDNDPTGVKKRRTFAMVGVNFVFELGEAVYNHTNDTDDLT
jgi:uncharacterized membrane protein